MKALNKAHHQANLPSEREHVTPYIWKHPGIFRLGSVINNIDFSKERWTLDTKEDLELIKLIAE